MSENLAVSENYKCLYFSLWSWNKAEDWSMRRAELFRTELFLDRMTYILSPTGLCSRRWAGQLLQGVWCRHLACGVRWEVAPLRRKGNCVQAVLENILRKGTMMHFCCFKKLIKTTHRTKQRATVQISPGLQQKCSTPSCPTHPESD